MATSKQEKIYNKIIEYYDYADRLLEEVEHSQDSQHYEQFAVIEDFIVNLEKCADSLSSTYIDLVQNGDTQENIEKIRDSLNKIAVKIEECKAKIIQMSNIKDKI